jgi:hypothetical protein
LGFGLGVIGVGGVFNIRRRTSDSLREGFGRLLMSLSL